MGHQNNFFFVELHNNIIVQSGGMKLSNLNWPKVEVTKNIGLHTILKASPYLLNKTQ